MFDPSLSVLAGNYLGCEPILDLITMWWSAPGPQGFESAAAQQFHYDADRLKFLKIFFYLTDVRPTTGPHCFVRGSHRRLVPAVAAAIRHSDAVVESSYSQHAIAEICGPVGTILLADTSGLHKGKPLTEGCRLILQVQFSNCLFGAPIERLPLDTLPSSDQALVAEHPGIYRILLPQ